MTSQAGEHAPDQTGGSALWSRRAHEVIESVADRHPERIALVCGDDRLTYTQLDQRANAVAWELQKRGVRPGDRVALAMPRCTQLFVTLLGVLKAGGVYVPVDPKHPPARNRRILEDAAPSVIAVLSSAENSDWVGDREVFEVGGADARRAERPVVPGSADDLAYILFTSGSTGEPKGVPIKHDGISRLVLGQDYAPFGPELSWLKLAPMGFDASTVEIYGAWMWGAALVVWDRDDIDADAIADLIEREHVRACFLSFGLFSTLLDVTPRFFEQIRVITTGGEPVLPSVIKRASDRFPDMQIVVAYGPTEATAFTTTFQAGAPDLSLPTVPLGKPLDGLYCRLIDEDGNAVPEGASGEICIGGVGITPGYLHRPDLNEVAFIPDPIDPSRRLYRSGDLAKVLESGDMLFLGRIDTQVKVRGNRVELGEIESVIERLPTVHRAAAAIAGETVNQHVVVAVVPAGDSADPEQIRSYAADNLPEYMVPNAVGIVDRLPHTENGKIDRAAVAASVAQESQPDSTAQRWVAPSTDTESLVAKIWCDVLGVDRVGRSDTFLRLGGHSLRAIVACARIRSATGVQVPVPKLMQLGELADVARWIDQQSSEVADTAESRLGPAELSPAQLRLWMLDRLSPGDPTYTITIRLRFGQPLERGSFERACHALVDRHEAFRTAFSESSDGPRRDVYALSADSPLSLDVRWTDGPGLAGSESFERQFASEPFELGRPPLVRFVAMPTANGHDVLIGMHHIVSDGWSSSVVRRDFVELYKAEIERRPPNLPELPPDPSGLWAEKSNEDDRRWWNEQLADADETVIPSERSSVCQQPRAGVQAIVSVPDAIARGVRDLAGRLEVTPYAVVCAAYHVWLQRVARTEDIVIGTPIACRETPGLEDAVGFFMATVPVRTSVRPVDTAEDVVRRVSRSLADSDAHRAIPFHEIVKDLGRAHDPDRNPLFEVFFNFISMDFSGNAGGLTFEDLEVDNGTAKFDLTCYALQTAEELRLKLNARAHLADETALERWGGQIVRALEGMVGQPGRPIGSIPLLAADESRRFVAERSRDAFPIDPPMNAFARVRRVAELHPDRPACVIASRPMRYEKLIRYARTTGRLLSERGLKPGDRVLCDCRDHQRMGVTILGVLAAGGCYVPIDSGWPAERIREIARIANARFRVVDQEREPLGVEQCEEIALHELDIEEEMQQFAEVAREPDAEAYVLFTSGTTGHPKGIVQTHAGLCAQIETYADSIGLLAEDRVGMTSSHAFDSAVMDMFGAWFRESAWCPIDLSDSQDPSEMISAADITVLHAAPSVLRAITDNEPVNEKIRTVVLGGEAARPGDMDAIARCFPNCRRVVNGMGMSESSLTVQWQTNNPGNFAGSRVPIGGATSGSRVRLLATDGSEADLVGEIEVESDRIAAGFLDSDSGALVPIGTPSQAGRRFATGDIARVRADGQLEHLGRADAQLKVSGVRIEPEDVRAALCALEGVLDAAVVAGTGDGQRNEQDAVLYAAVTLGGGCSDDAVILRDRLADRLPRAMLSARIAVVDRIPRTGGGKVDARAVQHLCRALGTGESPGSRPLNPIESSIAEVFAEVLGVESVGGDDDFFALGGSSLLALRAFARLRDQLGMNLPVITMFRAPTPVRLARLLEREPDASGERALVELSDGAGEPVYFMPGIGGNPHSFSSIVGRIENGARCVGYQLPGVLGERDPLRSIEELAEHFVNNLPDGNRDRAPMLVGYSFGGTVAIESAIRLQTQGLRPGPLLLVDAHFMAGLPRKGRSGRVIAHAASFLKTPWAERWDYVARRISGRSKVRNLGGEFNTDGSLASIKDLILANRDALDSYRPKERYRGDVLLFRARQPDWMRFHRDDLANGWRAAVDGRITVIEMDVDHNRVLHKSSAGRIADEIRRLL